MPSLQFLHLTDLHIGQAAQRVFFPSARQAFETDLRRQVAAFGQPIHAVLFTGDLVFSGKSEEYTKLADVLAAVMKIIVEASGGPEPVLITVPGNHDLVRPGRTSSLLNARRDWFNHQLGHRRAFWAKSPDVEPWHQEAATLFAGYTSWLRAWYAQHPEPADRSEGIAPGDFSCTIDGDGVRLGIVGLNTALFHLDDQGEGALDISPIQLHASCGGDAAVWVNEHQLCFLLTHHPPEALSKAAHAELRGDILLPEWFQAHVFGHMHEPRAEVRTLSGASPERSLQGPSLFGLENWGAQNEQRIHGYTLFRLSWDGRAPDGTLRMFPRLAKKGPGPGWRLIPDNDHYVLERGESLDVEVPIRRAASAIVNIPSLANRPALPPAPGGGHDSGYVARPEEADLLQMLKSGGAGAVVIRGGRLSGKSTLVQRLLTELKAHYGNKALVVLVRFTKSDVDQIEDFTQLARMIAEKFEVAANEQIGPGNISLDALWARPSGANVKLKTFVEKLLEAANDVRLILALDGLETLMHKKDADGASIEDQLYHLLRDWYESRAHRPVWKHHQQIVAINGLRIVNAVEVTPVSEYFNVVARAEVLEFGIDLYHGFNALHGMRWSGEEIERLHRLLGGSPFLVRSVFYLEATGQPKASLLDQEQLLVYYLYSPLRQIWHEIEQTPVVAEAYKTFLRTPAAIQNLSVSGPLLVAGLLTRKYQETCPLLGQFVRRTAGIS